MAGEPGAPKGPVPRRPPPKRAVAAPPAPPPQGPASLPPPPDAHVESVLTPRPAVAHNDTSLFQLKEAVRVVRDPRLGQPPPDAAQEPIARAGGGLGWEEPAGRPLPFPAVTELSGVAPAAPAVRAPVAVTGGAWDRPAHPFAVAGRLSAEEEEEGDAPAFDEPAPVEREERVRSVRQLALLAVSVAVFLFAGGMAVYAVRATDLFGFAEPAAEGKADAAPASAPPPGPSTAARQAPLPPEPVEPEAPPERLPERLAEREEKPERPAPSAPPDPAKPRPFEQLAAQEPTPTAPRAEPAPKPEAEKPAPKPSTKGGTLVLHGAANAGGIKLILMCPPAPDRSEVVRPGGVTTVNGVSPSCSLRLQCLASSTSVQAKYLLSKTDATCQGCNKDRSDPVCQ